ncbi:MAG: hypothetical protein HYS04_20710 [Acidobacteria bacterium]|nr:hypothetical protein [Acidobacteriota bacterium]
MQQADAVLGVIESLRDRTPGLAFGMYSGYSGRKLASGRRKPRCLPDCARTRHGRRLRYGARLESMMVEAPHRFPAG